MNNFNLLGLTEEHMSGKKRLPVLRQDHMYPTEASVELDDGIIGTCARKTYYRYTGSEKPEPYSNYTQWVFRMGKAVETDLLELWKQMGLWLDNNVKFYDEKSNVSGEFDIIVKDPVTGEPVLTEVKSMAGYNAIKQVLGNKSQKGAPKEDHLLQILVYLSLHQNIFKYGKLIYLDKTSTSGNAEFNISLTNEGENTYPVIDGIVSRKFSIEQIFDRYKKVQSFIDNKELPPRDYELFYPAPKIEALWEAGELSKAKYEAWKKDNSKAPGDWNCAYCNYKKACWDLG